VSHALIGGGTVVNGSGLLFTLQFTAIGFGTSPVTITSVELRDSANSGITPVTINSGSVTVESPTSVREIAPREFALNQNYPNPFNPSTEIKFSVEVTDHARLDVYNALGQKVVTLFDDVAEAGHYQTVRLNGSRLASGMYFYRLASGKKNELKKLLLLK
jgi:hypothetical protein